MRTIKERNQLFEEHQPLAETEAKRRFRSVPKSVLYDDLLSAAYEGLLDASSKYDESLINSKAKKPFKCYAVQRIRGAMTDFLRSCNWGTRNCIVLPTSLTVHVRGDDNATITDTLASDDGYPFDYLNQSELFEKILADIPFFVRQIFYLRFKCGLNTKEIASWVGIPEMRIAYLVSHYLAYLRNVLNDRKNQLYSEV